MTEKDAAAFLGLSPRTLQRYRITGGGPVYRRLGLRRIAFLRSDLLSWAESGRFTSSSNEAVRTTS